MYEKFLNRVLTQKVVVTTVPKKDLMIVLPYLGKVSLQIRTRINRVMKNRLPHAIFELYSRVSASWSISSHSKTKFLFSYVLKFKRGGCSATYYGKTKRHFKVRICEHLGVSALTGKRAKGNNDSTIKKHLFCNHSSGFDDFSILASNNNDIKVTLMEGLLINRDHPPLDKNRHSLPLELFDDTGT